MSLLSVKASKAQEAGNDAAKSVDYFAQARDVIAGCDPRRPRPAVDVPSLRDRLEGYRRTDEDVERALLSAVDFAETPEDVLHVAARLEEIGSDAAALRLCQKRFARSIRIDASPM